MRNMRPRGCADAWPRLSDGNWFRRSRCADDPRHARHARHLLQAHGPALRGGPTRVPGRIEDEPGAAAHGDSDGGGRVRGVAAPAGHALDEAPRAVARARAGQGRAAVSCSDALLLVDGDPVLHYDARGAGPLVLAWDGREWHYWCSAYC